MQRCPERLGRYVHVGAEWRHDGRKGLESCVQFRPRVRSGETQIGRKDEHGLVKRRMAESEGEIGGSDIFKRVASPG